MGIPTKIFLTVILAGPCLAISILTAIGLIFQVWDMFEVGIKGYYDSLDRREIMRENAINYILIVMTGVFAYLSYVVIWIIWG